MNLKRDKLFLLKSNVQVPAYPGKRFHCWHCSTIEGVLNFITDLAKRLDIERVVWQRPRHAVVSFINPRSGHQIEVPNNNLSGIVLSD